MPPFEFPLELLSSFSMLAAVFLTRLWRFPKFHETDTPTFHERDSLMPYERVVSVWLRLMNLRFSVRKLDALAVTVSASLRRKEREKLIPY